MTEGGRAQRAHSGARGARACSRAARADRPAPAALPPSARPVPAQAPRRPPRRAALRPRTSGASRWWTRRARCVYGRNARPALHPGEQHQARGERRRRGAAAARLDGAHQPLRRRAGRRTASCRATWCSTAAATRPSASAATPPTPCARAPATRDPFARLRRAGRRAPEARRARDPGRPGGRRQLLRAAAPCIRAGRTSTSTGGTRRRSPGSASTTTASTSPGARAPSAGHAGGDHACRPTWATWSSRTAPSPCRAGGRSDIGDRFFREPGTLNVWAEGTVALDQPTQTESFAMPDPNLFTARALRQVLQRGGHRGRRHHPLDHRLDALPPGPERAAAGGGHVAAAPRLDLPDPQHQPELVRRDGAQAARPAVRPRGVVGRGARASSAGS